MKKIFLLVPVVALLAAGCGSSKPADNTNNQPTQVQSNSSGTNLGSSSGTPSCHPSGHLARDITGFR